MKSEGSQAHTRLPSLEHQYQENKPPQHLAVQISRSSIRLSEIEGGWKLRRSLKGPACRLPRSQALALGSGGGTAAQDVSETYREGQLCGFKTKETAIVPVWGSLLSCGWWADTVFPVLRPPHKAKSEFSLAW